jgi:hypothetical protein
MLQPKKRRRFGRPHIRLAEELRTPGVDMRSQEGRRYFTIVTELLAEFGDGDPSRIRELAGLKFSLEQIQAEVIGGSQRAREDLVRVSNLIARREGELRTRKAAKAEPARPLHERLMAPRPAAASVAPRPVPLAGGPFAVTVEQAG